MSVAKRSLRIFALPLSKQSVDVNTNTIGIRKGKHALLNTYYHFVTGPHSEVERGNPSLLSRLMDKAANTWADWGKATPGTWKVECARFPLVPLARFTSAVPSLYAGQGVQLRRTPDRQARFRRTGTEELRPLARPENHEPPHGRKRRATTAGR